MYSPSMKEASPSQNTHSLQRCNASEILHVYFAQSTILSNPLHVFIMQFNFITKDDDNEEENCPQESGISRSTCTCMCRMYMYIV